MLKVKVESLTQRGREKEIHEAIISNEYQTEHKNFDGSILKVRVTAVDETEVKNISSSSVLSADATNFKEKYEKCIAVIKKFDAGIIGMYDL